MAKCPSYIIKLLLFFSTLLGSVRVIAQIDTIYKRNPDDRILALVVTAEVTLLKLQDSAATIKKFDTLIQSATAYNDERMHWYCEYYKNFYSYFAGKRSDANSKIAFLESKSRWVDECPFELIKAFYKHKLGYTFFYNGRPIEGLTLMLQADHIFNKIGYRNIPDVSVFLYEIANVYYSLGDYNNGLKYAKLSEENPLVFDYASISNLNTAALCYAKMGNNELAKTYYLQALSRAHLFHHVFWIAIASGNLGRLLFREKAYTEAIPYFVADYNIDHKIFAEEAMYAAFDAATCYIKSGDTKTGEFYFGKALQLRDSVKGTLPNMQYYRCLYNYYDAVNNRQMALKFIDSFILLSDSVNIVRNTNLLSSTQARITAENRLSASALQEEKEKNRLFIHNLYIGGMVVVLLGLLLLVNSRLRSVFKDKKLAVQARQIAEIEKANVQEKLNYAEGQLENYLKTIAEKSALIEKVTAELTVLKEKAVQENDNEKLQKLSALLDYTLHKNEDWEEFIQLFEDVHPGFFSSLAEKFPTLSVSEIRLLALLRLNLSRREISYMLGVSVDAVAKTKYRLKKKFADMGIQKDLEQLVAEL